MVQLRLTGTGVTMLGKRGSYSTLQLTTCIATMSICGSRDECWVAASLFAERTACTMLLIGAARSAAISSCRHGCHWEAALGVLPRHQAARHHDLLRHDEHLDEWR